MLEKLKSLILNDQVFYSLLIVLVAIVSFCLGRLSLIPDTPVTNRVEIKQPKTAPETKTPLTLDTESKAPFTTSNSSSGATNGTVVGSRSGSKYHLPSCPGAKQIKAENLINFSSREAAEAAGYKPAANCPQLQ
ncbi:MAG TPA: Ada metal-binding domain-containing protein [Candidatus Paceibacterota bacterium]|nr:Ada metal-binding domain-containing protein [Candidatus Paceibacterota bacterium]HMO83172.1 Ada metal-binding domain-containing protein [Candidatus Paceibacterota bacterium]